MINLDKTKKVKTAVDIHLNSMATALSHGKTIMIRQDSKTGEIKIFTQKVEKL